MVRAIYLDSSNYSDLSQPSENIAAPDDLLLSRLRKEVASATVFCPLSPMHILEAIHADLSYRDAATRRARLMRELCVATHLVYPTEVGRLEAERFFSTSSDPLGLDDIMSKDDEWFGIKPATNLIDNRRDLHTKLLKRIDESGIPRRERRKLRATLKTSTPSDESPWRDLLARNFQPQTLEFPFSLLSPQVMFEWFLGVIDDAVLNERLLGILRDPPTLIGRLIDLTDHRSSFFGILRNIGGQITENLSQRMGDLTHKVTALTEAGVPLSDLKIDKAVREELTAEKICSIFDARIGDLSEREMRDFLERSPSCRLFARASKQYILQILYKNLHAVSHGRPLGKTGKPSDFGDLMHSLYIPYVDAFRCDASFGDVLRQSGAPNDRLVPKRQTLVDLLDRIASSGISTPTSR